MFRREPSRFNPKEWGDTRDEKGAGRRVYVGNLGDDIKVHHLKEFFEPVENIEGISINKSAGKNYAFVQFKRPQNATDAILRNQETFMGREITIRFYRRDSQTQNSTRIGTSYTRPHRDERPNGRFARHGQDDTSRPRHRTSQLHERYRNMSRSRSRSRSRSSERRRPSRDESRNGSVEVNSDRAQGGSYSQQAQADISREMQEAVSLFQEEGSFRAAKRLQEAKRMTANLSVSTYSTTLPDDVALTLKLTIAQRTARDLSLEQIQNIISYFEAEKLAIQCGAVGPSSSFDQQAAMGAGKVFNVPHSHNMSGSSISSNDFCRNASNRASPLGDSAMANPTPLVGPSGVAMQPQQAAENPTDNNTEIDNSVLEDAAKLLRLAFHDA